jgi:hypothetical protein
VKVWLELLESTSVLSFEQAISDAGLGGHGVTLCRSEGLGGRSGSCQYRNAGKFCLDA